MKKNKIFDKIPGKNHNIEDIYSAYKQCELEPEYVFNTVISPLTDAIKYIAFYFPQYHPFMENHHFHGQGFTEWTNVTKAKPMFPGHYQPRLPGELGFYDTRIVEIMERQIALAKQYGIYGFCFHHYFFSGKKVMRVPYNNILTHKHLDIRFCLHWANEPWTRTWDGIDKKGNVLLPQTHSYKDDIDFFYDILPAISDERYIKIAGRPLLIIYRPKLFPDMQNTVETWKNECIKNGIQELFLAMMQTTFDDKIDPGQYGLDAAVEYPPHLYMHTDFDETIRFYDKNFSGKILDYNALAHYFFTREKTAYTLFKGIVPDWDATARKMDSWICSNASPAGFKHWLDQIVHYTQNTLPPELRFIFINAWNEWAEGAYLEPDRKYGYASLYQVAASLNSIIPYDAQRDNNTAVIANIMDIHEIKKIIEYMNSIPATFDFHATSSSHDIIEIERQIRLNVKNVRYICIKYIGIQIENIVSLLACLLDDIKTYKVSCYIDIIHNNDEYYIRECAQNNYFEHIIDIFTQYTNFGMIFPYSNKDDAKRHIIKYNTRTILQLAKQLNIKIHANKIYDIPDTTFWFRPCAISNILQLHITLKDFVRMQHASTTDDTHASLTKAIKTLFVPCCTTNGYDVVFADDLPAQARTTQ